MKRQILWLMPILLVALLMFSACEESAEPADGEASLEAPESSEDPDYDEEKVLATVNGDEINQGQFDAYIFQLKNQYESQHGVNLDDPQHGDVASELLVRAMDQLVEQKALVQRAKELDISVPSSVVDQQIEEIIEQQGSQEAFETFLEDRYLTQEDLEILIEEDYLISQLYDEELDLDEVSYDDEELSALYDRFVEQREAMDREPESFEEVEAELAQSLIERLRHDKQQEYIDSLIEDSEIEYFYN